eukprot:gene19729-20198_t
MEISDRSNEENDEIEEVTIEFGNFDDGNELGNVETSFGEVAAPTGGDSVNSSENMALEENVPEHSVEDRLDNLEQLMALMQRQKELRRKEDLEEALRRAEIEERRAAEDRALIEMLMSRTKVLEVKVGTQDTAIQECEHKILFLQTQSAHTDIALRDMNDRIGEIAQNVHDIRRPWGNVTMRKTNVDDKDEGFLAESKEEEICLRLDEVETSAKIHEEGIKTTQDKVDRLNDQVEYLTGLTESMGTRMESTLDFVEKAFTAQQKDYVLDGENGSGPAHVTERRTRDETPALARDQSVQVETEVEPRYGGYVRIPFAGNKAGKPKKGRHSSGGDGGGSDSDESKGLTRDYLDTIEKSPLLSSPAEVMAMMSETPGTARPGVFPYYPYAGAPLAYGTGPVGFPSQIANYPEQLLVTHYMDSRVISMLLTTIKTEDKFEYLWNKIKILGGVLQTEHQLLTNKEVYSVLTYIVRPKSRIEMNKWLGQSVWDATSYSKFKNNRSYIQTYIDYYLHAWTHYKERFELLVEILCHEDTKKYFPVYVKRKNGTNGLIDYFMNGTPDVQFSRQVQEHYISQEEYEKINDFPTFVDKYFRALKKLRDNSKLIEDTVSIFKGDKRSIFTPPAEAEFAKTNKPGVYKKPDRVHALHGDIGETRSTQELMFSEEEGESLEWDLPPEDDSVDDDGDLPNDNLGDRDEVGERNLGTSGNTTEEYNFAKEGRCEFMEKTGKCIYSHDAEDIKKYKAAKALGKETIQTIAKGLRQQGTYDKTHSEFPPKATSSQGARADTRVVSAQSEVFDPGIDDHGDEDTELVLDAVGDLVRSHSGRPLSVREGYFDAGGTS